MTALATILLCLGLGCTAAEIVGAFPALVDLLDELRPARESGGGSSEQGGRAGTHRVIAHDGGVTNR